MNDKFCQGFKACGIKAGIKKNGGHDLGLIYAAVPSTVAGVFTKNRVAAAPVKLDIARVKKGLAQAIIVNAGNANCCTGDDGLKKAEKMAQLAAEALGIEPESVLVASTGVIGQPFPIEKIEKHTEKLVAALSDDGITDFSKAILTTDLVMKLVTKTGNMDGKPFTITGVAKGSGMIRPDMATMLCFVMTDIDITPAILKETLLFATDRSFNRITVDGDTSTNDTVLVMANALSGARVDTIGKAAPFQALLTDVLTELAKMIVRDGEGATKLVEIKVVRAESSDAALKVAETIANSNLVKTAIFGEDANWGRIIAAAGRAGVPIDPDRIQIYFNDIMMVENGMGCGQAVEDKVSQILKQKEYEIVVDLNMGNSEASVFTCDFSFDYVKINADYRS
ncbi:MAG: bifunctional glutamate N-acetyltransferase/amino-acid acetyltransferase ArgJ [Proteobacteria bacterium]|nr:bifunctional glutamate N-acetyltransferase/amino-acid acetyltransferase ArgJ [Pseudomonadota bacterium]